MPSRATRNAIRESFIVGDSAEMGEVVDRIEEVADGDFPVLIEGERGTGRERVARSIHYASERRASAFVSVRAEAIPRTMISDELFGMRSSPLRRANGGTLLLKDVAALPKGPQRGLAKVLKRRDRDSDTTGELFDVRFIAASDADLETAVTAEYFDKELYERLGARKIRIPPLRRRLGDLPRLAKYFLKDASEGSGRSHSITSKGLDRLAKYPWPGNVAELKDVIKKLASKVKRGAIDVEDVDTILPQVGEKIPVEDMAIEEMIHAKLRDFLRSLGEVPVDNLYDDIIARVERPLLALVMEHTGRNQLRASKMLGLNRNTLRKKLAELGLDDAKPGKKRT